VLSVIRKLRRRMFTPDISETRIETRGFHDKGPEARTVLETVGASFLTGLAAAAGARRPGEADRELENLPLRFKGFAYEGAAMGFALADAVSPGRPHRAAGFLRGTGDRHVYMAYVGFGWAMARLPRMLWPRAVAAAEDPLLRWLVLDGYGFHQAYFHTPDYVFSRRDPSGFRWPGDPTGYAARAIDQGIGRAMWFVAGTHPGLAADLIDSFPEHRHQDLYSGAGLAATYAGGCTEAELTEFVTRAGVHAPFVAQASAFAAQARVRAGLVVPHTELATQVFCGTNAAEAAAVTTELIPATVPAGGVPSYEIWRCAVAEHFQDVRVRR
jgi:hypothetical protein